MSAKEIVHLAPEVKAMPPGQAEARQSPGQDAAERQILRFHRAERHLHWALAAPFLVCLGSALVLFVFYNPDPQRPFRDVFSWTHRISGLALTVLPLLAILRSHRDLRVHFYNVRQAWIWVYDDLRWLLMLGASMVSKKVRLPDQGKFNAAEKINFMVLMTTYPFYIVTGALMWLTDVAFLSWILHVAMALFALPLIGGHLYMALVSSSGRPGLTGMTTGHVPAEWARHHYGNWYREHHEPAPDARAEVPVAEPARGQATRPSEAEPAA